MQKIISITLSFIILISLISLTIVINFNIMINSKTINKIASNINYLDLINIKMKENELKETYDSLYLSLQQGGISKETIEEVYKQDFFQKITAKIIDVESNYLLTGKNLKTYTITDLNRIIEEDIQKMSKLSEEEKQTIITILHHSSSKILTIENIIRSNINNISSNKLKIIHYLLSSKFKVILLCLIIISILLQLMINKEKLLPYIFIPTIICSILELFISIFTPHILFSNISNKFLQTILFPYLQYFLTNLLFISLILLGISVIYLMANESIVIKEKNKIKPKLKGKKLADI